ncbi:MAG: hypothetical protein ABI960_05060 [Candidatus Eisenbacteria bacterium]
MSTIESGEVHRSGGPLQKSLALHMLLAVLCSIGMHQTLHRTEPVVIYLVATWATGILMFPAMPLPAWRLAMSTIGSALVFGGLFYLFPPGGH